MMQASKETAKGNQGGPEKVSPRSGPSVIGEGCVDSNSESDAAHYEDDLKLFTQAVFHGLYVRPDGLQLPAFGNLGVELRPAFLFGGSLLNQRHRTLLA